MLALCWSSAAQLPKPDQYEAMRSPVIVQPVLHSCFFLQWNNKVIYVDPHGGKALFDGLPRADLVLITDIHRDHLDTATLFPLLKDNSAIVAPKAVADQITGVHAKKVTVLGNGHSGTQHEVQVIAVPMYNLPDDASARHPKGRGNGYVISVGDKYIYISGDTEDIPEMRELKNIDIAFMCMNEPYTMTVAQAADAVLAFRPKVVYPYHYRGQNGFSDLDEFQKLVAGKDPEIKVVIRDWYSAGKQ
jgi:L-ascorbate metabolism protein UlaG (beta-lactamase superfamily)